MAVWQPNPLNPDYTDDILVTDDGNVIARVERFYDEDGPSYPCAVNVVTQNLERGGAMTCHVEAKLWAERVAGLHPVKPGDERPPFYYAKKDQ